MYDITPADRVSAENIVNHLLVCFRETYSQHLSGLELENFLSQVENGSGIEMFGLDDEHCHAYVATDNQMVIGSVVTSFGDDRNFIWGMYIQAAYQSSGLGTLLLRTALELYSPGDIVFLSPLSENSRGISFYKKNDFESICDCEESIFPGRVDLVHYMKHVVK